MTLPTIFMGHGAPPLLEDELWKAQLREWAGTLPRPRAILMVSAHWEDAPVSLSSLGPTPLVYDFYGFPSHFYTLQYPAPTAPELAASVTSLLSGTTQVRQTERGLDHGAYVPLMVMYPEANIPVLQMSMPTLDPQELRRIGAALAPLRDEGVLIVGSGFMTHGLPYISMERTDQPAPGWSREFDAWATEVIENRDIDSLEKFEQIAPAVQYAHPRTEHFAPLFVAAGAADDLRGDVVNDIDGYWYGLAKRSFTFN